jgi:cob(I)alamin adenosyltransferase
MHPTFSTVHLHRYYKPIPNHFRRIQVLLPTDHGPRTTAMKIYTKTGDDGTTGLFGGGRVRKDDRRIEAYGTVDELNAAIGLARSFGLSPEIDAIAAQIQNDLFVAGAELATPTAEAGKLAPRTSMLAQQHFERLEKAIDRFEETLPPLREFILPGGNPAAAALHLCRTICRRGERRVLTFAQAVPSEVSPELLIYLNRLSDLLFVMARAANATAGVADIPWHKET